METEEKLTVWGRIKTAQPYEVLILFALLILLALVLAVTDGIIDDERAEAGPGGSGAI